MKITREALKTIVKETMIEESEYQEFFKKALEKAGGSIPKMSEEEKKAFFNKIEKTWKGKGEKNEISETELEEAQSPAQKAAFAKMLAAKDGKDEKEEVKESVNEGVRISLFDPNKNKILKSLSVDRNYKEAEKEVETLNKRLSTSEKNKGYYWKITTIGESVNEGTVTIQTKDGKLHHYPNFKKDDVISFLTKNKMKQVSNKNNLKTDTDFYVVESVNEAEIRWGAVDNAIIKYIKYNVKVLEKPIKARDEALTKKMLKGFIDGLVNAQRSLNLKPLTNEAPDGKKRFMFDFYTDSNERNTERETNFLATTLESAIKAAEHICKVTGYAYVEIYYKDLFLGSMKKQNGFKFVEGKGYSKFKSTN